MSDEDSEKTSQTAHAVGVQGSYDGEKFSNGSTIVLYNWFVGRSNPSYKDEIRRVVSATTPAGGVRRRFKSEPGFGTIRWKTSDQEPPEWDPAIYDRNSQALAIAPVTPGSDPDISQPTMQSARNQAIAKLYETLQGFESSAQAGEDLGEISQTAKLLRSPAKPARDFLTGLLDKHQRILQPLQRSSGLKPVNAVAKGLADLTLEYRFGIKPLINTVASITVGLQNRDYLAHYYPFQCTGKDMSSDGSSDSLGAGNAALVTRSRVVTTNSVRYSGVWGVQSSLNKRAVDDVASLRWKDVIPTVWNLIPYSFLIDYVTNIGDILNGISVPYSGVRWCVESTRSERVTTNVVEGWNLDFSPAFELKTQWKPGTTVLTETAFSRNAVGGLPIPTLEFSLPKGNQWLNIGALILSRVATIGRLAPVVDSRLGKDVQSAFAGLVHQRGLRVPYPFHH
jgi:hypothetical protein